MNWKRRAQSLSYTVSHQLIRLLAVVLLRVRVFGRRHIPRAGGGLVCANHQSYFDPLLVGLSIDRHLTYLARKTLFGFPPFGWLIQWFNAIPLEREGLGMAGIKETLRRLRAAESVLMFPEGTRTLDGRLQPLKGGLCVLARRAGVPLIPVGLDGAFQAWPRHQPLPRLARIAVVIGPAIEPEVYRDLTDEKVLALLEESIRTAFEEAKRLRG